MRLKVNEDRIFVILEPMVTTTTVAGPGGTTIEISLPENHHERSRVGLVKQVGRRVSHPGKWWQFWKKPNYRPGDRVLLSVYAGVRIHLIGRDIDGEPIDEDRHRIIRQEEILCVLYD
jgi:co-chaperonin GroES (HSP10)